MGFKCGIVGLPNVGKSTIFNAITQTSNAAAANFPFCTIEPNVGVVPVPDPRVDALAEIVKPQRIQQASMQFVDIAGLVKGASKGEGLGNAFLGNIRETDAIAHVVRCFDDGDVIHVAGKVSPADDIEVINSELCLKDLDTVEKATQKEEKIARTGDKAAKAKIELYKKLRPMLDEGQPVRTYEPADENEALYLKQLLLLTTKPTMYVANVGEEDLPDGNAYVEIVRKIAENENAALVIISGKIESELVEMDEEDRGAFLDDLGLKEPGLNSMIRAGYELLGLRTYFTAGVKEVRAWTIRAGWTAPQAAGVIHTDFERGFIRAETIAFTDFVANKGEAGSKEAGKMRIEGKEYVVADGDVMHFRFSV